MEILLESIVELNIVYDSEIDDLLFIDDAPNPGNIYDYKRAFIEAYHAPCLTTQANSVLLRCHNGAIVSNTLELYLNGEIRILKAQLVDNVDIIFNDLDGNDLFVKNKSNVNVHVGDDDFEEDTKMVSNKISVSIDFITREETLQAVNIIVTQVCGEATRRGTSCKNRTKHQSGKCHYHRHVKIETIN
jgi:hypothetical protein